MGATLLRVTPADLRVVARQVGGDAQAVERGCRTMRTALTTGSEPDLAANGLLLGKLAAVDAAYAEVGNLLGGLVDALAYQLGRQSGGLEKAAAGYEYMEVGVDVSFGPADGRTAPR